MNPHTKHHAKEVVLSSMVELLSTLKTASLVKSNVMSKNVPHNSAPNRGKEATHISRGLRFPLINDEMSNLLGKILTIVDASVSDKVQCKAMKDLIRDRFGVTLHDNFWHYCYASAFNPSCDVFYKEMVIESELPSRTDYPPPPSKGFSMPEVPE